MECSALSAIDEPLAGTATVTTKWLLIEHNRPWGRDVLGDAALGEGVSRRLAQSAATADVRVMFIRRPGRRAESGTRTVFLVNSVHGWYARRTISDTAELLDIDLSQLDSTPTSIGAEADPIVLVCAHGRRDQCCARLGRPIAAALAADFAGLIWECSHTGGHRFAPSMIVLPFGYTYGRLSGSESAATVSAALRGEVALDGLRGRTIHAPRGQVAEIAIRERFAAGPGDLNVEEGPTEVAVYGRGRSWRVRTASEELPPRSLSCGADAAPVAVVRVMDVFVD